MNLYVRHFNGTEEYSKRTFQNLIDGGCIENQDIIVILKRYPKKDFYNLRFPNPPNDFTQFEFVSQRRF